jgi:hypothetical protein
MSIFSTNEFLENQGKAAVFYLKNNRSTDNTNIIKGFNDILIHNLIFDSANMAIFISQFNSV